MARRGRPAGAGAARDEEAVMVLYSAADLVWATRIKGTADAIGVPCRPVRSVEMLEARLADSPVKGLVVDLEAPDLAMALIGRLGGQQAPGPAGRVRIVAFGPHVEVELLRRAKELGADAVMARGAFASRLPTVLQELEGEGTPGDAMEE